MLRTTALLPMLLLVSCPANAQLQARVEGTVLDDASGAPLGKAVVLLGAGSLKQYGAVTSADGAFIFTAVDPGKYSVKVERGGYLGITEWSAPLEVQAGEQLNGMTLKLSRQGIIAGKVAGGDTAGVAYSQIHLWKMGYRFGYRASEPVNPSPVAGDGTLAAGDGTFVIGNLTPGRYLIETPGVKLADARVIDIDAGREIRGVVVQRHAPSSFRISGTAVNPVAGARVGSRSLVLDSKDPEGLWAALSISARINRQTGAFTFDAIPPGDYRIRGYLSVPTGTSVRKYIASREVHLDAGSATGISLAFMPMATINGTASEEGGLPARPGKLYVALDPATPDSGTRDSTEVVPGKLFHLQVPAGKYKVFAGNALEHMRTVKAIRFNGQDLLNGVLGVPESGGKLDVVFAGPGGEIAGVARDAAGHGAAGATVVAWSRQGEHRMTSADAMGRFVIYDPPPGSLSVAACESVTPGVWALPEFRAAFEKLATRLLPGAPRERLELKAMSRVQSEAEEHKLR